MVVAAAAAAAAVATVVTATHPPSLSLSHTVITDGSTTAVTQLQQATARLLAQTAAPRLPSFCGMGAALGGAADVADLVVGTTQ